MKYIIVFILCIFPLFADDVTSLLEDRKNVLRFGIDGEVITLLDDLTNEKNTELATEIAAQFTATNNLKLRQAILSYFEAVEMDSVTDQILYDLSEQIDEEAYVLAIFEYLRTFQITVAANYLDYYAQDSSPIIAAGAIKTIGELGLTDKLPLLQSIFEDGDAADAVQSEILLAFGKLKNDEILPLLLDILEDPNEDRSNRWYACAALGEIGGDDAFTAIKNALDADDTILRTYAISAIAKFDRPEVANILIQEGLRDSFWKVRITSIEEIEKHGFTQAVEALKYKASNDPEQKIRERAVQALGALGGEAGVDFLVETMLDEKVSVQMRLVAAKGLLKNSVSNASGKIAELITYEWDKKGSRLVEFVAKELSITKGPGLASLYEKLLTNDDLNIKIYAIRGIGINGLVSLKPAIEALNTDNAHPVIKKAIVTALEQLN